MIDSIFPTITLSRPFAKDHDCRLVRKLLLEDFYNSAVENTLKTFWS